MILGLLTIAIASVFIGLFSGLLGIGGNVIAIPTVLYIFIHIFHFPVANAMHLAIGTCMVVMVFTAFSSAKTHYAHHNIDFKIYKRMAPGIIIGDIGGGVCAGLVHGRILEKFFGVFLIVVALYMLYKHHTDKGSKLIKEVSTLFITIFAFIIGFKSGLLGIGGGMMLTPFFFALGYESKRVVGTNSICTLTIALIGAITFLIIGQKHNLSIPYTVGFIYLPAVLVMSPLTFITARWGARLSLKVPHHMLKISFAILIFILGIKMLLF